MNQDTELMNAYIQKQNKLIGELINKNLMLEAQVEVISKKLDAYTQDKKENEEAYK
jgi:hypothetical protein